ncbi:MAG: ATP phosphoribosyltransferase regulatory subunit [Clostridiales bacterium]|nr:ATP phosphoribosyltransferase regulatory subunit [Clostridiales bacterium]
MRDNKLHTPDGFKDFLPDSYWLKLKIERRVEEVFHRYGFASVSSPMLEYIEVFEGKGSAPPKQMYRFLDQEGDILALRSDMTPPIARMAAAHYSWDDAPLRFCYVENAFRRHESYKGKAGEFTEAGVELIGLNSPDADAEVIAIAIRSLLAAGLTEFRVDIGQAEFLRGILEETGLPAEDQAAVLRALAERDWAAAERLAREKNISGAPGETLSGLHKLIGGADVLRKMKPLTQNVKSLRAVEHLELLHEILEDYGVSPYVVFDLSMTGHLDYYTGILFRGYCHGIGFSLLDGGRYDGLIARYGPAFPAVGFAIKIDHLMSVLSGRTIDEPRKAADVLLAFTPSGRKMALAAGDELRRQGLRVENSLAALSKEDDLPDIMSYVRRKNIPGVLFFEDSVRVQIANAATGEIRSVTVEELLRASHDSPERMEGGS